MILPLHLESGAPVAAPERGGPVITLECVPAPAPIERPYTCDGRLFAFAIRYEDAHQNEEQAIIVVDLTQVNEVPTFLGSSSTGSRPCMAG